MKLARHALAIAVIAASTSAFALDQLSDDSMSDATGQAGLTITTLMGSGVSGILDYTDTDGGTGAPAAFAGTNPNAADILASFKLTGKATTTIDAGATSGNLANVLIDVTTDAVTGLTANITSLSVCSNAKDTSGVCSGTFGSNIVALPASGVNITLKNLDMQILLGATSSQHFIQSTLPSTFNLTIGTGSATGSTPQLSLLDPNNFTSAATEGGVGVGELLVGLGSTGLTTYVDACTTTVTTTCANGIAGLQITSAAGGTVNVNAYNVTLGNVGTGAVASNIIGNVAVYGLTTANMTTIISGH